MGADIDFSKEVHFEMYQYAYKKMKKIKGFYIHLWVFSIFNVAYYIWLLSKELDIDFSKFEVYLFTISWGIGVLGHALSVFGNGLFFGKKWEQRKIKEFMEENNK